MATATIVFWVLFIYLALCIIAKVSIELVEDFVIKSNVRSCMTPSQRSLTWLLRLPAIWYPVFHIVTILACAWIYIQAYLDNVEDIADQGEDQRIDE